MSETLIASLNKRIEDLTNELAETKSEAKNRRLEVKDLRGKLEKADSDLAAATRERDDLKSKVDATPGEMAQENERLKGEIRTRDHRDAWGQVKDQLADKVSLDKVWAELQYKPGDAVPTPEQIKEQVGRARESAPYLFKPETGNDASRGANGAATQASPPGPGYGRGNPSNDAGLMLVRRSDAMNPEWMATNQGAVAKAQAEGRFKMVD